MFDRGPRNKQEHRINEDIIAPMVRLVGEEDESMNGVIPYQQAMEMARRRGEDLVEITGAANPPIVRIITYSKYRFELKKKEKENKAKQHVAEVKEIRFGPNTGEHDFDFKCRHAAEFLKEGHKIKAYVTFHGRTIVHKDRGYRLLEEFAERLADLCKIEAPPRLEGKRLFLYLAPKK